MFARSGLVVLVSVGCSHGGTAPSQTPVAATPPTAPAPAPAGDRPWGPPVAGESAESVIKRTLALIGSGQARPAYLGPSMTVGPALWGILVKLDPPLASAGVTATNALPHKKGAAQTMEMRTFVDDRMLILLLRSPGFGKIGRAFGQAKIRAATEAEREMFYDFVPFEIAGKPVTISERDADRLVVYLDDAERIIWMDVLSGYATASKPAAPPPAPAAPAPQPPPGPPAAQ